MTRQSWVLRARILRIIGKSGKRRDFLKLKIDTFFLCKGKKPSFLAKMSGKQSMGADF
jgi:hypothetical protein